METVQTAGPAARVAVRAVGKELGGVVAPVAPVANVAAAEGAMKVADVAGDKGSAGTAGVNQGVAEAS